VHDDIERILFSESEIRAGIERTAEELTAHYGDDEPVVFAVL
jgi:hypoxanthine-guanine phosphoribosyltransferase